MSNEAFMLRAVQRAKARLKSQQITVYTIRKWFALRTGGRSAERIIEECTTVAQRYGYILRELDEMESALNHAAYTGTFTAPLQTPDQMMRNRKSAPGAGAKMLEPAPMSPNSGVDSPSA